jgi:hypothetical protein
VTFSGGLETANLSGLIVGNTYFIRVYHYSSGSGTGSFQICVTHCSLPAQPDAISGNAIICSSSLNTYSVTPVSGATSYTWTLPSGWIGTSNTNSINTEASSSSGNVTVTANNTCGISAVQTLSVTVTSIPVQPGSISGSTTVCSGSSNIYSITAVSGATSYTWTLPSGWSGTSTTNFIIATAGSTGNITVTANNSCGSSSVQTLNVTVNPLPSAINTSNGPTTFCQGGSVTLTAGSNSSYAWSTGASTQSINVSESGNYSVIVMNANGCTMASSAISVTVNPLPNAIASASGSTVFCTGDSVQLCANTAASYLWSNGKTTQCVYAKTIGSYNVMITNADGCTSATSNSINVNVNNSPAPAINASGPTTFCQGGSVTLTVSTADSYLWSTGATSRSIVVTTSGNYSVNVTNSNPCNGSGPSSLVVVAVNPAPSGVISLSGSTTFCQGGFVTLTASAGNNYLWTTGSTIQSIVLTNSGNYGVTVINGSGCSATSVNTNVIVNPTPAVPTIIANGPTAFCQGSSVTLTSSSVGSYLWSTGVTTQSIVIANSGNYSVTVTNGSGCSASSTGTGVTVNPLPATPTITDSESTLSSSSASGNQWYFNGNIITGATSQFYNVSQNGFYTVCVMDANGCSSCSAPHSFNVTAVIENMDGTSIIIYPNPNKGLFTLDTKEVECEFIITNMMGETVLSQTVHKEKTVIDLSAKSDGIYFIHIKAGNNPGNYSETTKKIIIHK